MNRILRHQVPRIRNLPKSQQELYTARLLGKIAILTRVSCYRVPLGNLEDQLKSIVAEVSETLRHISQFKAIWHIDIVRCDSYLVGMQYCFGRQLRSVGPFEKVDAGAIERDGLRVETQLHLLSAVTRLGRSGR